MSILYHDRIKWIYKLQIKNFQIANESIYKNYQNFIKKYDILIKDKISHI